MTADVFERRRAEMRAFSRRLKLVLALGVLGIGIATLAIIAGRSGTQYYVTPSELLANNDARTEYRLGGRVVPGSIEWDTEHKTVRFLVTDGSETEPFAIKEGAPEIPVVYADVIPDLFEERVFVVLGGKYGASTGFDARSLVIKHESEFITERKESLE